MPWKSFLSYVILACSVLSLVIGYLLWSRKHVNTYSNRLLACLLFVYAYIDFVTSLVTDGTIIQAPHFFRTAAPLNYAVGPLIYLYVRASLLSTKRFRYPYGWLFLPALLNYIELTPFYLKDAAYKVQHLQLLAATPNSLMSISEGWLPPEVNVIGYTLSNLTYSLLAGRLLLNYLRHEPVHPYTNSIYGNWIKTFVLIEIISNLLWTIELPIFFYTRHANFSLNITYVIAQLVICMYILQRPTLLYGAYWLENKPGNDTLPRPTDNGQSATEAHAPVSEPEAMIGEPEQDIQEKLSLLEDYMTNQRPYLQPRLSLANVAVATNIPPYLLSAILNRTLGVDFRDYVNAYRVRYLCELLRSNDYNHLTLEGISTQAGFSSKTTFFRAFQKHTGLTPAQYSQLENQPD